MMLALYDKHLAPDGKGVDYASLARDPGFRDYVTATTELQKVPRLPARRPRASVGAPGRTAALQALCANCGRQVAARSLARLLGRGGACAASCLWGQGRGPLAQTLVLWT